MNASSCAIALVAIATASVARIGRNMKPPCAKRTSRNTKCGPFDTTPRLKTPLHRAPRPCRAPKALSVLARRVGHRCAERRHRVRRRVHQEAELRRDRLELGDRFRILRIEAVGL